MKKLCAIGEALIDFIPSQKGIRLKDVPQFTRVVGGAPANVAGAVSKLGGESLFITQLGQDAFGDHILDVFKENKIDTTYIKQTTEYDTSLAFVSLASDGNRDFKFYRRHAADLHFNPNDIVDSMLEECGFVHFCSVSLVESPMKQAHIVLLDKAKKKNIPICFDPNLRLSLWEDEEKLKQTIHAFIPYANVLKISDEELEFITGYMDIEKALPDLFTGNLELLVYTMGKDGATLYTKSGRKITMPGYSVEAIDTTGAGDSFIGAFLYKLLEAKNYQDMNDEEYQQCLDFANAYAALTTTKEGALSAMATLDELNNFMKN